MENEHNFFQNFLHTVHFTIVWYGDNVTNIIEENSSTYFIIQMH